MAVVFKDFSVDVKAEINDTTIGWLYTWAEEIASNAKRNCALDGEAGTQLRGSYRAEVNETAGKARIGTPLEAGYWEEWGTGEYAAHGDGRKGWWLYKEGYPETRALVLKTAERMGYQFKKRAKAIERSSRGKFKATNGRRPNYTLEKAFKTNESKAKADLERLLRGL